MTDKSWINPNGVNRDPEYDFIPPLYSGAVKKGVQCGECGIKFDYGQTYGFCCQNPKCPRR